MSPCGVARGDHVEGGARWLLPAQGPAFLQAPRGGARSSSAEAGAWTVLPSFPGRFSEGISSWLQLVASDNLTGVIASGVK